MSGARSNIVPMPQVAAMPTPQMFSGGFPAGCCPPGGDMNALLQCYCDIQSATAFIKAVVTNLAETDPEFQQTLANAVLASGAALPLIGVTNGTPAQAGQVGEFVQFTNTINIAGTGSQERTVFTAGVLQPGDWDLEMFVQPLIGMTLVSVTLDPQPVGLSNTIWVGFSIAGATAEGVGALPGPYARGLFSVPTLLPVLSIMAASTAGTALFTLNARRRR